MRRTLVFLALCQALSMTIMSSILSSAALVGTALAPSASLATVPLGLQFLTTMLMSIPASMLMQKKGRRFGFTLAACFLMITGVVCASAIWLQSFWLLCLGLMAAGVSGAFMQFLRFAAIDVADAGWESRAVSWVLAGGLVAAFTGPSLAAWTRTWIEGYEFAASYLMVVPVAVFIVLVMAVIKLPLPTDSERSGSQRSIREIAGQFPFVVAVAGAMIAYGVMNLLMTATPLAMHGHHFQFEDTAFIIQWHLVGMFLPSFFTGHLIYRFGVVPIMLMGVLMFVLVVVFNAMGNAIHHYWLALVALGVGWNFLYIGGTTLLGTTHTVSEKGKVQGLNDTLVFSLTTLTAMSAGVLYTNLGWLKMNWLSLPLTMLIGGLLLVLLVKRKPAFEE